MKTYKPTSDGQRSRISADFDEITRSKPEKSLLAPMKQKAGRNNTGRITVRHRGGGHKKRYRIIDFKRSIEGAEGTVFSIEYDPNRSARIALVKSTDGRKFYMIAPDGLQVGEKVMSGIGGEVIKFLLNLDMRLGVTVVVVSVGIVLMSLNIRALIR